MPNDAALAELFARTRTIAVIGAKDTLGSPVDRVGRYLIGAGFTVIPVHPARATVWGLPARRSLAEVAEPIDIVNVFRAPQHCAGHAAETLALARLPRCFWMQSGIVSRQAREMLAPAGILVIEDRCIMVEHRNLSA